MGPIRPRSPSGGYETVTVPSDQRGLVDLEALKRVLDADVAGIMLTNPNTLGLFEEDISEVAAAVHSVGGLLYYDGANLNAILGSHQAWRHGLRHRAHEPAQDLCGSSRRWGTGRRTCGGLLPASPTSCPDHSPSERVTGASIGPPRLGASAGSTRGTERAGPGPGLVVHPG